MPEMDGYEASRQIRLGVGGECYKSVPIVAMTANAMKGDKEKCIDAGMSDYLAKPVEPESLLAMLNRWLIDRNNKRTFDDIPNRSGSKKELLKSNDLLVWDEAKLLERMLGKKKMVKKLILSFLDEQPQRIRQLKVPEFLDDVDELYLIAHTVSGIASNLAAVELAEISSELELACKNNETGNLSGLVSELIEACDRLKQVFESYINS